jgi:UDP-N-acetylglucosamine/UDP-N-acetylgalactosamine 4-epimerase
MTPYLEIQDALQRAPRRWLVTGVAGFIGSHLLEKLLRLGQSVVGLDSFVTGYQRNLDDVAARVGPDAFARFQLIRGDIRDARTCLSAAADVDVILHQAALGSVPRSMEDPLSSHTANVDGFVNMMLAAQTAKVSRVVYASSSSVYGDEPSEPKVEERRGHLLSPYAATKLIDEVYADTLRRTHGVDSVGLRYFNVFGARQDPLGAYAAVIPRWTEQLISGEPCSVYGDGSASRDFCYIDNVVQANLLAALAPPERLGDAVFNVACGARTSLLELFAMIRGLVAESRPAAANAELQREAPRSGDILHSLASIERARDRLGYRPEFDVRSGMAPTVRFYLEQADSLERSSGTSRIAQPAREAS